MIDFAVAIIQINLYAFLMGICLGGFLIILSVLLKRRKGGAVDPRRLA